MTYEITGTKSHQYGLVGHGSIMDTVPRMLITEPSSLQLNLRPRPKVRFIMRTITTDSLFEESKVSVGSL